MAKPVLLLLMVAVALPLQANTVYFPQVVFGGDYSTTFVVVNNGSTPVTATISFHHQSGDLGEIRRLLGEIVNTARTIQIRAEAEANSQLSFQANATAIRVAALAESAAALQSEIRGLETSIADGSSDPATQQRLQEARAKTVALFQNTYTELSYLNTVVSAYRINLPTAPIQVSSGALYVPAGGSARRTLFNTGTLGMGWVAVEAAGTIDVTAFMDVRNSDDTLVTSTTLHGLNVANRFVLPVDVGGSLSTGIAIANVSASPIKVNLQLLREDGSPVARGNDARLSPLGSTLQVADFVGSAFPDLMGTTFKGTLVVEAAANAPPNSLIATAISVNEDALSGLPVIAGAGTSGSVSSNTIYFPQVVFGGGYSTAFTLMNPGPTNVTARLQFYDDRGVNRTDIGRVINVPGGGSTRLSLNDSGPLTVGWAELAPAEGTLQGMAALELRAGNGVLIAATSVPGIPSGRRFVLPVDATLIGSTGIAIANVKDGQGITVNLRLIKEDGTRFAEAADVRISPLGARTHLADFLTRIFPQTTSSFKGSLVIETVSSFPEDYLVAAALTLKERGAPSERAIPAIQALPRPLSTGEIKTLDAANNFSFALWNKLNASQRGSNVFISPLSVSLALGMLMNGAANQTLQEMRSALQFGGATDQEINEGYKSLIDLLTNLDPAVKMQIADSIWYRQGFPFSQSFLDKSTQYFDAEVRGLDFTNAASLAAINGWVDSKTNHKIPAILDRIDPQDVMYLINAIYFKGAWRDKFDVAETRTADFHASDGSTQSMSLMHRHADMSYAETSTYQAVDLPYGNSAFSMTVLLPKEAINIETLAASFTGEAWKSVTSALNKVEVDLSLPRLKLEYERELNEDLKTLGMTSAFLQGQADFTRMSPQGRDLYISLVKQKTFVDVNELGTEAAAVTIVQVGVVCACPPQYKVMRIDRPYIFAIRERLSGTVLFMGKILRMP